MSRVGERPIVIDEDVFVPAATGETTGKDDAATGGEDHGNDEHEESDSPEGGRKLTAEEKLKRSQKRERRYRKDLADAKRVADEANGKAEQLAGRLTAVEQATLATHKKDLTDRVGWFQTQRDAALEANDTKGFSAFDAKLREEERKLAAFEAAEANGGFTAAQQQRKPQAETHVQPLTAAGQDWVDSNPWYNDKSRGEDAAVAQAVAANVLKDGFDPNDDEFYEELDRRLVRRGVKAKATEENTERNGRGGSPPLASARGGGSGARTSASKIPEEARKSYIARGWDLNDPKVVAGILERHGHRWKGNR